MTIKFAPQPILAGRVSDYVGKGYIAGTAAGIVTVNGQSAQREILLFVLRANFPPLLIDRVWSNHDGTYLFDQLSTDYRYLAVARDYEGRYPPFAYDFIEPVIGG